MASIIDGPGRGRFEGPVLCPVWWPPGNVVSLRRDYYLGEMNRAEAPFQQAVHRRGQTSFEWEHSR